MFKVESYQLLILFDEIFEMKQYCEITYKIDLIYQFSSYQTTFKYFDEIELIFTGEEIYGNIYGFKRNQLTQIFELFIKLKALYDQPILDISFTPKSKMLYINAYYSNIFFNITQCLNDLESCLSCSQDFHIESSQVKKQYNYGNGTLNNPFTTYQSLVQSFLITQKYKRIVTSIKNIETIINIHNNYDMILKQYILAYSFQNILELKLISYKINKNQPTSVILFKGDLKFSNFISVTLENISFKFVTSNNVSCSLIFDSIKNNSTLVNVYFNSKDSQDTQNKDKCNRISSLNTNLIFKDMHLDGKSFIHHKNFITSSGAKNVRFENFNLKNSTIGQFGIFTQSSPVNLVIDGLTIQGNICDKNKIENEFLTSQLFEGSIITVSNVKIQQNELCNINLLQASVQEDYQIIEFLLKNIEITDNKIQAVSQSILFSSLYSRIPQPDHKITAQNITIKNNTLLQKDKIIKEQYFMTNIIQVKKIETILLQDIDIQDSNYLTFIDSEESKEINIDSFKCSYSESYFQKNKNTPSASCIKIKESQSIQIKKFDIDKKIAYDSNLIEIINQNLDETSMIIKNSTFKNIQIIQSKVYKQANPILISAQFSNSFTIEDSIFLDNIIFGSPHSVIPSSSALQVNNLIGNVIIKNCDFNNSKSNSEYSNLYLQVKTIEIKSSNFSKSLYHNNLKILSQQDVSDSIRIKGGSIYAKTESLTIFDTQFNISQSYIGGFIYIKSFSQNINIDIKKCGFKQSFTKLEGSGLFLNVDGSNLNLKITDTEFEEIYQNNFHSSLISINQDNQSKSGDFLNQIKITNVNFTNIYGQTESHIFNLVQSQLIIQKSNYCFEVKDIKNSLLLIEKFNMLVPSNYLVADRSTVDMKQVILNNIIDNYQNTYNHQILFSCENTYITMVDCIINQSDINIGGIGYMKNGVLSLDNFLVQNIKFDDNTKQFRQLINLQQDEVYYTMISLFHIVSSKLSMIKSKVDQVSCEKICQGGFLYTENSELTITNSNFTNIKSNEGGVIYINNPYKEQIIQDCILNDNYSENNGGSLKISSIKQNTIEVIISRNQFLKNIAKKGKGGAIYISINDTYLDSYVNLTNNIIQNNQAYIGGGVKYDGIIPNFNGNSIIKNFAKSYGQNIFSYPTKLNLENHNDIISQNSNIQIQNNRMIINKHRSGGRLPNLIFTLRNENTDIMKLDNNTDIELITISVDNKNPLSKEYYIRGEIRGRYYQNESIFQLTDLDLIGKKQTSINLFVQSNLIRIENIDEKTILDSYSYMILVSIDDCQIGQISKIYNNFEECSVCEYGTYSFDKKMCQQCPDGAVCPGGYQIIAKEGYWRKHEYDELVISCYHLKQNCVGGKFGDFICHEGHIGPLCEECDIYGDYWGESYTKSGKYSCAQCSKITYNTYIMILLALWTLTSMVIAIKGDAKSSQQKTIPKCIIKRKRIYRQTETLDQVQEEDQTGVYLKIFTNYIQIISSIATFNLEVPSGIIEFPFSVGQPIQQMLNSLNCILKNFNQSIPIIYFRLIFSLIIPFIYLLAFIIGLIIFSIIKKKKKFPTTQIYTALMFLQIYLQPDLVSQMIASISCRQIGNNYYILSNVSFDCYTKQYYNWGLGLVLPALFLEVFLFPFLLYNQLRKNKEKLEMLDVKLKYGFLYKEYTVKCFFWEFLKMFQKISIILALNFYSQDIKTKGILVFIVITIYSILSLILKPYKKQRINKLDHYSTNVCSISVLMGVFLYENNFSYFIYMAFGVIIIINLWFILLMVQIIIKSYTQKIEKVIQKFLEYFGKRFKMAQQYLDQNKKVEIELPKFKNEKLKKKIQKQLKIFKDLSQQKKQQLIIEFQIKNLQKKLKETQSNQEDQVEFTKLIQDRSDCKSTIYSPYSPFSPYSPQSSGFLSSNLIEINCNENRNTSIQASSLQLSYDNSYFKNNLISHMQKDSIPRKVEVIDEAQKEEENEEKIIKFEDDTSSYYN